MDCEAVEMDDHRKVNLSFEGVHDTGPIMLWDCGIWEPNPESEDIKSSLERGILRFTLRGERLKGSWTLVRTNRLTNASRPIWNLIKEADLFSRSHAGRCVLEEWPNSASTGRTLEEIERNWTRGKRTRDQQIKLFDDIKSA
jgi:bifunctional non-homologous end joining protein LigD